MDVNKKIEKLQLHMIFTRMTFGDRVVALYFAGFYALPFLLDSIFDFEVKYYLIGSPNFLAGAIFALLYLVLYFLARSTFKFPVRIKLRISKLVFSDFSINLMFIVFLFLSFLFSRRFGTDFRHTESFSDAGIVAVATFGVKYYCIIVVLFSASRLNLINLNVLQYCIFISSIFLSLNSSFDAIFILISLYLIFLNSKTKMIKRAVYLFDRADLPFLVCGIFGVGVLGIYNKIGFDMTLEFLLNGGIFRFLEIIGNRLFYHFYSLSHHINNISAALELSIDAMQVTLYQFLRRFSLLIGIVLEGSEFKSASQINFVTISPNFRDGAGASPGLLGSIFFMPGSIFFIPIHIIFLQNISDCFSNIMGNSRKYNFMIYFLSVIVLQVICDSLIDSFNPVSIGFIALFFLVCGSSYFRQSTREK